MFRSKIRANQPFPERSCERCGHLTRRPREIERHLVCHTCFDWIVDSTSRLLAAAGRGNGLPLVELV